MLAPFNNSISRYDLSLRYYREERNGRDCQESMRKNYAMIMKLIKHVAESDQLRHLLNDLVTSVNDRTLRDDILEELMLYPGLVSTGFNKF